MSMSWRTLKSSEGEIEVGAKLGDFGPTKWYLKVSNNEDSLILKPTPDGEIPSLSEKIRGAENYWNIVWAKNKGTRLPDFETISRFWVDIVKSAYINDLPISSDVALISSLPFKVKGMEIIPKEWGEPIEDEIVVSFCNFWVGYYSTGEYPNKSIFRLSSYDREKFGQMSAKSATEYIDLHPIDDRNLILGILKNAKIIYLPDVCTTIANLRAIPK